MSNGMEGIEDIPQVTESNDLCIEEFEAALQNILSTLTKQDSGAIESSQIKNNSETSIQRFINAGQKVEKFFFRKRFILAQKRPEQFLKERLQDMKNELSHKEALLQQYPLQLEQWQNKLTRLMAARYPDLPVTSVSTAPASTTATTTTTSSAPTAGTSLTTTAAASTYSSGDAGSKGKNAGANLPSSSSISSATLSTAAKAANFNGVSANTLPSTTLSSVASSSPSFADSLSTVDNE